MTPMTFARRDAMQMRYPVRTISTVTHVGYKSHWCSPDTQTRAYGILVHTGTQPNGNQKPTENSLEKLRKART